MSASDPADIYASPDLPPPVVAPPVDEPETVDPDPDEPPLRFNPKSREDLDGLLYLGYIEKTFIWSNHTFVVRTLTMDAHLRVAMLIADWKGTYGEQLSWQTAIVAASIVSVDGRVVAIPTGEDEDELRAQFNWARRQFPWTIEAIWAQQVALEDRVRQALVDMGKADGGPVSIPS